MRITILAVGSRGDVQPLISLGNGLKERGHEVKVAANDIFKDMIIKRNLGFHPVWGNPQELLQDDTGKEWLKTGKSLVGSYRTFQEMLNYFKDYILDDLWEASKDSEIIIHSLLAVTATEIARKLNVPCFGAFLQPLTPTREFPAFMVPSQLGFSEFYNKFSGYLIQQVFWQVFRKTVNEWLRKEEMRPLRPFFIPFKKINSRRFPILYGFSRHVVPRPDDWPSWNHITGYWFLKRHSEWEPPDALIDFIESGPQPVFFGFGSMSHIDPREGTEVIIKALRNTGQRGIIQSGWSELGNRTLPSFVYNVDSIPHDWLFPRMAALVHHGGAGTTATGISSGVPSIIIPQFADQFFWAERVHSLGIGPAPILSKKKFTLNLTEAIEEVIQGRIIKRNAKELGAKICRENGPEKAARIIEKYCC